MSLFIGVVNFRIAFLGICSSRLQLIYHLHHHHVALSAQIFLTLSRHTSLSFIAFGKSSGHVSDVLLWIPSHGRAKAGRPVRTYIQQFCALRIRYISSDILLKYFFVLGRFYPLRQLV